MKTAFSNTNDTTATTPIIHDPQPIFNPYTSHEVTLKDLSDAWPEISKQPTDTILHAIANVVNVSINPDRTNKNARTYVIDNSLKVITDAAFNPSLANHTHAKIIAMIAGKDVNDDKKIPTAHMDKHITNNINLIRLKNRMKMSHAKSVLQSFPKVSGVFLPHNSFPQYARNSYINQITNKLKKIQRQSTIEDKNSEHVIHEYLKDITPPNQFDNKNSLDLPQFFLNKRIDPSLRRKLYFQEDMETICDWKNLPCVGTQQWCASCNLCKNDLYPATTMKCIMCSHPVHTQCVDSLQDNICYQCRHPPIKVWNALSGGIVCIETTAPDGNDSRNSDISIHSKDSDDILSNVSDINNSSKPTWDNNTPVNDNLFDASITVFNSSMSFEAATEDMKQTLLAPNTTSEIIIDSPNLSPVQTVNTTVINPYLKKTTTEALSLPQYVTQPHTTTILPVPMTTLDSTTLQQTPPTTTTPNVRFNETPLVFTYDKEAINTRMQLRIPTHINRFNTQWTVIQKIIHVLNKLKRVDPNITILPWTNNDNADEITNLGILQNANEKTLKVYFPRYNTNVKPSDNFVWIDLHMKHFETWESMQLSLNRNFKTDGYVKGF
jgi:hypothetical protein